MLEVNELWFRGSIAKEFLEQRGSSVSISETVAPAGRRVNRGREGFQHPRSRRGVRILVEGRRRAGWRLEEGKAVRCDVSAMGKTAFCYCRRDLHLISVQHATDLHRSRSSVSNLRRGRGEAAACLRVPLRRRLIPLVERKICFGRGVEGMSEAPARRQQVRFPTDSADGVVLYPETVPF